MVMHKKQIKGKRNHGFGTKQLQNPSETMVTGKTIQELFELFPGIA